MSPEENSTVTLANPDDVSMFEPGDLVRMTPVPGWERVLRWLRLRWVVRAGRWVKRRVFRRRTQVTRIADVDHETGTITLEEL